MYAVVKLLNGFSKQLTYKISLDCKDAVSVGSLVRVPLRKQQVTALVCQVTDELVETGTFDIKEIVGIEHIPQDNNYKNFIEKISKFYFINVLHFYARLSFFLHDEHCEEIATVSSIVTDHVTCDVILTDEQKQIVDAVAPFITKSHYQATLIHGVTGSGKTEVYKKLISRCIQQGKTVMLLVPEVALSMQFERLLKLQLPGVEIFGFHSASKLREKNLLWQALLIQRPVLIIGVHLPVMLPIANLGLIIVDEEHEQGFIEKRHPRLNSKELALWKAALYKIPIILGSATPSLSSLYNVAQGKWQFFKITKRFSGAFPVIQKVLLNQKGGARRKNFWISRELENAIHTCLRKKEQIIIYLNRRGYSFFMQCKDCGFIFTCPHCSVSLTLHIREYEQLRCHYCDFVQQVPAGCPECKVSQKQFLRKGIGTQQAMVIFKELFPQARIARADLDTTSKKRAWQETVQMFERRELDILIGTQTITKGYHFPGVTLVGILWGDINLHFPLYNASEIALQQIIQVAGRAGRYHHESRVIVQVMRDHSIFDYVDENKYLDFCHQEMMARCDIHYPPFARLVYLELRHKDDLLVEQDAGRCADILRNICDQYKLSVVILGPALPLVSKVKNVNRRHIFLKAKNFGDIHNLVALILEHNFKSEVLVVF